MPTRPADPSPTPDLANWLEAQRQAGRLDSPGQFTVDPEKAWRKLASSLLQLQPEAYVIKVIQAGVLASMQRFWARGMDRPFPSKQPPRSPLGVDWEVLAERVHIEGLAGLVSPSSLASAFEQGVPPVEPLLKHLWLAVLASWAHPKILGIEFTVSNERLIERLAIQTEGDLARPQPQLTVRPSPDFRWSWSWDILLRKKRSQGLWSFLQGRRREEEEEEFKPELDYLKEFTFSAASQCCDASCDLRTHLGSSSKPLDHPWQTLAESYDLAQPGETNVLAAPWLAARRAFRLTGAHLPPWYHAWAQDNPFHDALAAASWKTLHCDLLAESEEPTMMTLVSSQALLCRRAVLLPLFPAPDENDEERWTGHGRLYVVSDGALIGYWKLFLTYPGARVFVASHEIATDLTSLEAVRDQAWERVSQQAHSEVKRLLFQAAETLADLREQHPSEYESLRSVVEERSRQARGPAKSSWQIVGSLFPESASGGLLRPV